MTIKVTKEELEKAKAGQRLEDEYDANDAAIRKGGVFSWETGKYEVLDQ